MRKIHPQKGKIILGLRFFFFTISIFSTSEKHDGSIFQEVCEHLAIIVCLFLSVTVMGRFVRCPQISGHVVFKCYTK